MMNLSLLTKLLNPEAGSSDRFLRWQEGMDAIRVSGPFGEGLGNSALTDAGSYINWYLTLGVDGGWLALLIVLVALFYTATIVLVSNIPLRSWFFVAIVAGTVQFNAIATFFNPFLWAVIALFFSFRSASKAVSRSAVGCLAPSSPTIPRMTSK